MKSSSSKHALATGTSEARKEFLLEIYRQASAHLSRHVGGTWQTIGAVGAAVAVVSLDKNEPLNDYAASLVIGLSGWLCATALDGNNWLNRNIAIMRNVEREFLTLSDVIRIQPFFSQDHRRPGKLAEHFRIQVLLAMFAAVVVLLYHFHTRVHSGLNSPISSFEMVRAMPYATFLGCICGNWYFWKLLKDKDAEMKSLSPGRKLT